MSDWIKDMNRCTGPTAADNEEARKRRAMTTRPEEDTLPLLDMFEGAFMYSSNQMQHYARTALASAKSHFDRTIAERDAEIKLLKARHLQNAIADEQMQERAEAAERRAEKAEKLLRRCRDVFAEEWQGYGMETIGKQFIAEIDALRAEGSGK